jgi:hypothetical protein
MIFDGVITESADFRDGLAACEERQPSLVVLDLARVQRLNSAGVREWIVFVRALGERVVELEIVRASPAVVRQLSMVRNTRGRAKVRSIGLPYLCESCDDDSVVDCWVDGGDVALPASPPPCPACGAAMVFDDVVDAYLGFLRDGTTTT